MLAAPKKKYEKPLLKAVTDVGIILECLYEAYEMEGELVRSGKNMYATMIYPFVKMLETECTGIRADEIHKELWEYYLRHTGKDNFMKLAGRFMEPYETRQTVKAAV